MEKIREISGQWTFDRRPTTIGERIREVRDRNDWTQAQVADWSGLSAAHIAQFEGGRDPSARNLAKLATGLRVTSDWLLGIGAKRKAGRDETPLPECPECGATFDHWVAWCPACMKIEPMDREAELATEGRK